MSIRKPSRNAKATRYLAPEPALGMTLADVLTAIAQADLLPRQKHDMTSAVLTAAKVLGLSPAEIPALPRLLRRRLAEIGPQPHGIQPPRWKNIRSLVLASLRLMAPVAPGRHLNALSPAWQGLWDYMRITDRTKLKIGLSRFMRFCSAEGVEPSEVDVATYQRFAESLDNSLLQDPKNTWRCTRYAWAKARVEVPGWPAVDLPKPPPRPGRHLLPLSTFPESFQADHNAWIAHLAGADPLAENTHKPLRPESLKNRSYHAVGLASALVKRGRDPASLRSLADLVEIDTAKEALRFYLDPRKGKSSVSIAARATTLVNLAQHWVRVDPGRLKEIKAIAKRLSVKQQGLTEGNLDRLRQFEDPANIQVLLNLPEVLFAKVETMKQGQRAAVLAQTAVAISILLFAPMRIGNLTSIDIEQHLVRPGRAREILMIAFERSEVKNKRWLDYPVPDDGLVLLDRYLAEFRPLLAPPGSTALFPNRSGGPKSRAVLGPRISRTVFKHTGLRVNPHLFRHIAAMLQLDAEPGSYEVVRRMLGHASMNTTTSFYTGLETRSAARQYDKTRQRYRIKQDETKPRRRPRKGKPA